MVSGACRRDHITPVLAALHWLPVRQRVIFKTAVLVWKCLHGAAPRYLADLCVPVASVQGRHRLQSAASGTLLVPRTRTSTGQRSFAVNGPRTWNSLPQHSAVGTVTELVQASTQDLPVPAVVSGCGGGRSWSTLPSGAGEASERVRRRLQMFRLT